MRRLFYFFSFIFFLFTACQKERTSPASVPANIASSKGVFITNEGGFNFGNASVSYYNFETKEVSNKIFQAANDRALGDVLQSITIWEDQAYLVLNNSNKIEVVAVDDFSSRTKIGSLTSPRYVLPVSDQKAYVSDLYADWIYIVDLQSNSKIDSIYFQGWSEHMLLLDGEVFVTNPSFYDQTPTDQIFVIDVATDQIVDSIKVGLSPLSVQLDKNDKLWVLCEGHQNSGDAGGLYQVNPQDRTIDQIFPFSSFETSNAQRLAINSSKDSLYYSRKHIYQMPIDATSLPNTALIAADGRDLYGLGIHPSTGEIFVGESGFFQQQGKVFIYNQQGDLQHSFTAGVGINDFCFY